MEIKIKELEINIGTKRIIENISLNLKRKQFIGIIGPNGSGKSTILRTIYRALEPSKGNIYFDEVNLKSIAFKESAKKLGVMKQTSNLAFDFKVIDLVLLGRSPYKSGMELDTEEDYQYALQALEAVGMKEYEHRSYNTLSGGEQQRVMFARVLAGQSEALLLDEMTNHLDIYYQFKLLDFVKSLQTEVIAVMHDLNMAARYCDYIYCLKDGKIYTQGSVTEVLTPDTIQEVFHIKAKLVEQNNIRQIIYFGL